MFLEFETNVSTKLTLGHFLGYPGQISHSVGGPLRLRDRIFQVTGLGAGRLGGLAGGISRNSGGLVGSSQVSPLHHAGQGESAGKDSEPERVQSNRIARRPLPDGFFVLTLWGAFGGAVAAAILGVATLFGVPHFESKDPGKGQKDGDRQKPS